MFAAFLLPAVDTADPAHPRAESGGRCNNGPREGTRAISSDGVVLVPAKRIAEEKERADLLV